MENIARPQRPSPKKPLRVAFPVTKDAWGSEFNNLEEMIAHLGAESGGLFLTGSTGAWHGGIHITDKTTPWCALSGEARAEHDNNPRPMNGEQSIRCMADGEIVAFRLRRNYLTLPRENREDMVFSDSFVLVRHYVQPGPTALSGLTFYTLYMHLAPVRAYTGSENFSFYKVLKPAELAPGQYMLDNGDFFGTLPPGTLVVKVKETTTADGRHFARVVLTRDVHGTALKEHDAVWLEDLPGTLEKAHIRKPATPPWWGKTGKPVPDVVRVADSPIPVRAGEALGHMGFYQTPGLYEHTSGYQVHIECLSADDNLVPFLSNPELVEADAPSVLTWKQGVKAYQKGGNGEIRDTGFTAMTDGVVSLADVQVETVEGKPAYYCVTNYGMWLAAGDVQRVSKYDLTGQGFEALRATNGTFDLMSGWRPAERLTRLLLVRLRDEAARDHRPRNEKFKDWYQELIDLVDADNTHPYMCDDFVHSIHLAEYRMWLYKTIVQHPGEWYAGKDDKVWKPIMDRAKKYPEEQKYLEFCIENMNFMAQVPGMEAISWYMHPLVFLDAVGVRMAKSWAHSPFADLIGHAESKNDYTTYNRTYPHPNPVHIEVYRNTTLTSMTIGQVMIAQRNNDMFATGRFQITTDPLKEAVKHLNLDVNALYDESTQDHIFNEYIIKVKRPSIISYLEGSGSVEDAAYACAQEFASVGVKQGQPISPDRHAIERTPDGEPIKDKHGHTIPKKRYAIEDGVTYYKGDGLNKAFIMPDDMINSLEESKNESK